MKPCSVFAVIAAATVSVSAIVADTNAARLARGLTPKAPTRRDTAKRKFLPYP